eukprot:GFUD01066118.1.p1 GENE.GFUD01066118.1~~GFUD01066118.1.p1  ORF type:complete len:146 (+),score=25.52 GFUD01066118.1:206-643(+)
MPPGDPKLEHSPVSPPSAEDPPTLSEDLLTLHPSTPEPPPISKGFASPSEDLLKPLQSSEDLRGPSKESPTFSHLKVAGDYARLSECTLRVVQTGSVAASHSQTLTVPYQGKNEKTLNLQYIHGIWNPCWKLIVKRHPLLKVIEH